MPLEIERKFRVTGTEWRQTNGTRISQGYLSRDLARTVRIRLKGEAAFLTIKGLPVVASRVEFEYPIPVTDAQELMKLCIGPLIQKTRYTITYNGFKWEVDEFFGENAGLVVAEVELEREDQAFDRPSWLGQEVTENPKYFNSSLICNPYSTWSGVENP